MISQLVLTLSAPLVGLGAFAAATTPTDPSLPTAAGVTADTDPANEHDITSEMVEEAFELEGEALCSNYTLFTDLFSTVEGLSADDMATVTEMGDHWLALRFEQGAEGRLTVEGRQLFIDSLHACDGAVTIDTVDTDVLGGDATGITLGTMPSDMGDISQIMENLTPEQLSCLMQNMDQLQDESQALQVLSECDISMEDLMAIAGG